MAVFEYKGVNQKGKKIQGVLYAGTIDEAKAQLTSTKIQISKIKEADKNPPFWKKSYGSVSFKEKLVFLKYLSTMLQAGLTIKKALSLLTVQVKSRHFANIIDQINDGIGHGQSFADSLRQHPKVFGELFVSLVAVGEASGTLPKALEYLQDILKRDYSFRKKIKGAMSYPAFVLVLVLAVSVGLVRFIVPRIVKIFGSFDVELPILTRILIKAEELLRVYWWGLVIGLFALVIGGFFLLKIRSIRKLRDGIVLHIPLIGSLVKQVQIANMTRVISSMLQSGLPLIEAIEIATNTMGNLVYKDYLAGCTNYLSSGGEFSSYLGKRPNLFPLITTQMVKLGEGTGSLPHSLSVLSELTEEEVNDKIKMLTGLIGPVMLILMASMVGGIAVSIITPIYQLPNLIQSR